MSRNFDLLQRAEGLIQRTALFSATVRDTSAYSANNGISERAEELQSEEINEGSLPCAGLLRTEKQQIAKLVANLFARGIRNSPRIVAVIPAGIACSSARITACAAEVVAEHSTVCVVDADSYNGDLHDCFGLSRQDGFPHLGGSSPSVRSCARRVASRLWVLSAGAVGIGKLGDEATRTCLTRLRSEFAYSLFVCPPLLNSPDVLALATMTDGVLLVIRAGVTRRENALAAAKELLAAKVSVLGAVFEQERQKTLLPRPVC